MSISTSSPSLDYRPKDYPAPSIDNETALNDQTQEDKVYACIRSTQLTVVHLSINMSLTTSRICHRRTQNVPTNQFSFEYRSSGFKINIRGK